METNEVLDNEIITERKNPFTLKSFAGLVAVIALALALCAPYAKIPGAAKPAEAPVSITASVETPDAEPAL